MGCELGSVKDGLGRGPRRKRSAGIFWGKKERRSQPCLLASPVPGRGSILRCRLHTAPGRGEKWGSMSDSAGKYPW